MKNLIVLMALLLTGCASVPNGWDRIGDYNTGQFSPTRNPGFVKLYTPENEEQIPDYKLRMFPNCGRWEKRCEWHCLDYEY